MKRSICILVCLGAALSAVSCVTAPVTGINDSAKRIFDAWTQVNYPDAPKTFLGSVIIQDQAGTGDLIGSSEDTPYVYCDFQTTDLTGTILSSTSAGTAKQLGSYSETAYYGPQIICREQGRLSAGIIEMMQTMRVGGTRTAAVPGWLMTTEYYATPEEYLANGSGTEGIYTFTILQGIRDIERWEIDSLSRYMARHYPHVDSTAWGYYYIQTKAPKDTSAFDSGSTVYINYTGRNLTGQVFDSTIADTTKRYRIYSESATYEPVSLSWPSEEDGTVTFSSGSEPVTGFEKCVHAMRAGEEGICIFYSGLGYGLSGANSMIPGISPLIFEIQMLGLNEDGSIDSDTDEED